MRTHTHFMTSGEGDVRQTEPKCKGNEAAARVRDVVMLQGASSQLPYLNGRCKIVTVMYTYTTGWLSLPSRPPPDSLCPSVSEEQLKQRETFPDEGSLLGGGERRSLAFLALYAQWARGILILIKVSFAALRNTGPVLPENVGPSFT